MKNWKNLKNFIKSKTIEIKDIDDSIFNNLELNDNLELKKLLDNLINK